jgi:hypothetical protein
VIHRAVLAVLVVVATSGCGALTGRPLETWAQDRSLTARVKTRLASLDTATVTRIHVDTYEGIVYLTGGVDSVDMKRRAEEAARGVHGVEQVVNNLHLASAGALAAAASEGSASPTMEAPRRPPGARVTHPLMQRFRGVTRADLETGTPGWTRYSLYDDTGRRVATVYSLPAGELARTGAVPELTTDDRIDHAAVYRHGTPGAVRYDFVLWHVTREDVARLE